MNFNIFQSMRNKMIVLLLIIALLPLFIVGLLFYNESQTLLTKEIANRLTSIRDIKAQQIKGYFTQTVNDIRLLAQDPITISAIKDFEAIAHPKMGNNDEITGMKNYRNLYLNNSQLISNENPYYKIHSKYHPFFKKYKEINDYYDILIVDLHSGDILYTVIKEDDFGTSLLNGAYANTNIGHVFNNTVNNNDKNFTSLEDFAYYPPSKTAVSFIAAPIFDASKLIGVLILQLSIKKVDAIMQYSNGLGENGETILLGEDDHLLRSNSRFFEQDTLFNLKIDNYASRDKGKTGIKKIIDSNGKKILVAYTPLQINGLNWSLHAKIDWDEATSGMRIMLWWSIFIIGISIIIIIRIAILFSNNFINPIRIITHATHTLIAGNMNVPLDTNRKDEIGQLAKAFQQMVTDVLQITEDIVQVSNGLAEGNLSVKPKFNYQGNFVQIKNALNNALYNQQQIIKDFVQISQGMADGNLQLTTQAQYKGDFIQIKDSLTIALNNLHLVVDDIVQVSQGLAKGNLNVVAKAEYSGDFIQIKQALEIALSSLGSVIKDIVLVSKGLAAGNLDLTPQVKEYHGDFIQIQEALSTTLSDQREVIEDIVFISEGLLMGNLAITSKIRYRGDFAKIEGVLVTLSSILSYLVKDIVQASQDLADGKIITTKAEYVGDFAKIKTALEKASQQLVKATKQNSLQDWLKTGHNQLNDQMSGEQNIVELTHNMVSFLTLYLDANIGLCYLIEEPTNTNLIKLVASHAHNRRKNIADEFEFSKGLVERSVKEQKIIAIEVASDLSEAIPKYITVIPFLYENSVKGIILLGNSANLTEVQLEFINQVMPTVGVAINSVEVRTKMQELLQQTQIQTQELEQQQEELKHNNEELQSQSEELQIQSEELRQSNESLEERTDELERQKQDIIEKNIILEKVKQDIETKAKEIELASKYKSEFLANMSHELRTPLNSLLILAQLLADNKDKNLTDKQVEYARTIYNSGINLLKLINDILDLSKVEAGKIEINIEDVLLTDLIMNVEQEFRPLAENKNLVFQITIADDIPKLLHTDGQRLKQILNNLLSNAFKFTSEGEVKITIYHPSRHNDVIKYKPNETIVIEVSDTGIGIPESKQESIFAAFQQADGTTSRNYGGTGLGLSISRQLARLLGGELKLRSEEGKGSSFILYLPQKSITANEYSDVKQEMNIVLPTVNTVSNISIDDRHNLIDGDKLLLIIEDDFAFVNILLETARDKDFKCLVADDGKTGLQLAEEFQPDAIILDIDLPRIDGLTVMERLKANPKTKDILIHFISASEISGDAIDMAIGCLRKPVNMEQLSEAFKQIEQLITKQVKNLLVISDSESHIQQILDLITNKDIQTTKSVTIEDALHCIKTTVYDCIILDMDIEHRSSNKLIKRMQNTPDSCKTPVIIYSEQELTPDEEILLQQCTDNLVLKSLRSPTRLLDEATLFLHQLEANLPEDKQTMLKMVHNKTTILKYKKVMIVDDDIRNVFALVTILENKDMEVLVANNGEESLILLEKHDDIAIILMDIMMPTMDGYETMKKIRKQPKYKKLPIIALTAKAMKGDKTKCIEAGANDYLAKPIDSNKLISLMRVWLYQ
ncbi:MAG TPA: response regulator [Thioploca sp.]|nr:response regulator [Thioploca sp.]